MSDWFLYVVQCADKSLYTGITTDVERRVKEHNQSPRGARYTKTRRPVELLCSWPHESRSEASSAEHAFKNLSRLAKLQRIASGSPAPENESDEK